jgi:hypothetical protein
MPQAEVVVGEVVVAEEWVGAVASAAAAAE